MNIRKFFFERPIRTKISAAILIVLLGISIFNLLFFPAQQKKQALEGMKTKGKSIARMLTYNLSPALDFDDRQSIEEAVKGAFQDKALSFIRILRYQYHDTLFFQQEKLIHTGHKPFSVPAGFKGKVLLDEDKLYVVTAIKAGQRTLGALMLGFSLKSLKANIAQKRRLIFGLNFLILIIGIVVANYLSGLLTKPIRRLSGAALQISKGEWGIQIPVDHSDEIGVLANTFNRMSRGLKESKNKLEEYSRTLGQKVGERTAELRRANQELTANEATITKMLKDLNLMNRELSRTKNQLENIFKSVVDRAILTINTEGMITFYSKSSELIFGYEAEVVVDKKWIHEFFAQNNDFVFILLEHTREAGIYKGEAELNRRSKQLFPAIVTITPLKGKEGILSGYTIIVEDITEKKKTEENIRLLSLALESATDGAVMIDLNGKVIFVNRSYTHMHGYEPYEMIGKLQKDFYPEPYWPLVDQSIQQIYTEGSWSGELNEPRKDGSTFPAQISASLIKDPQGRPVGVLGICKDISEKKKMEQEILQSNKELSALNTISSTVSQTLNLQEILNRSLNIMLELTHSSAGWIFLVDRERKTEMKLVAHQGLSRKFVEEELKLPQDNCLCWEVVKSKQPRLLDITNCPRLNGSTILEEKLQCHIAIPLRSKDEVLGVMNIGWQSERDFSERELEFFSSVGNEIGIAVDNALLFEDVEKAKEKLQKLNRKLEEVSQIKSEYLANTSHELRTPLNSIIGFLGLVLDRYCVNREEEREFLHNAQQSAKHLLSIINDVLDLAKIEAGRMELDSGEVDLKSLFEEVDSLTQVQAQQKKLKLSFVHTNHPSPKVYADSGKLRQVIINLVGNAIKFTDKGKIVVRSKVQEEKGNVLIQVEDTGIGISPQIQEKLFEKFRQVDGSSTRRHGGTGLGLTITKNLVEMMGGMIKLGSPGEGKGTKVSFTVPIYRETEKGGSVHSEEKLGEIKEHGKDSLALIVEDDPIFSQYLDELLQAEGFTTLLARTADDAVTLAKDLHPQIVLLDFSLPQKMGEQLKNGKQIVHILHKDLPTRNIPIIIITGQDLDLVRKELSMGEPDLIPPVFSKPVDSEILLKKIRAVSNKRKEEMLVCKVN
ncbi:MAG: PAS domain S-box protein [candidate division Zixibacteria bacterium]|nr:PAS domain S-box protein [candidate division Zixibacteria bacterium]